MIKRKYTQPIIQTHIIDSEISLVMMSEGSPPGEAESAALQSPLQDDSSTQQNSFESNPFGE